ncbi:uncharacterized protein LOC115680925 [Syzygium oleosum]|uniref:uncharacterized protein LOC115680925 n=1 Tax=Syzygium oleosum TaxID=219896 RepID=UPI0011D1C742|nr:uncharacterized protein LOC115680925 [Syzygium oleosum]
MASSTTMAFLALLVVLLPMAATAADSLTPVIEELCNEVQCGKGSCVVNTSAPFAFECQCEDGWKRTRLDNEDNLKFLPCVIPNCSVEYSCMPAPPPVPSVPYNTSVFDPCYWIYCGGGTCIQSATYEHTCQCNAGYTNLMNVSVYPCFNDCAIGNDCSKLGIKLSNSSATGSDSGSYAHMFLPGKLLWMTIFTASMALVLWN